MTQLARLISILTLLKSRRILTAPEIAERYEVSVRTVYRDIRKLEEAGVPIMALEGQGYALMEGYHVAPVQFTEQEANALITAEHLVKLSRDASFRQQFDKALTKIKSVFRDSIKDKSELLQSNIYVFEGWDKDISSNILSEIQLAITNFETLEIHYQKLQTEVITPRKIEPVALYSSQNKWILIAWCHLRDDYRAFRVDRIRKFLYLHKKFADRKFSLKKHFEQDQYQIPS